LAKTKATHPFEILPHLKELSESVLFGDVWERPELSKRDRSLITCSVLAAQYRTAELEHHMKLAVQNGVTQDELRGLITHIAFYSGWPSAMNAGRVALSVFEEDK
jgi:4-carboxymuconolactone decarboxylase